MMHDDRYAAADIQELVNMCGLNQNMYQHFLTAFAGQLQEKLSGCVAPEKVEQDLVVAN